MTHQDAYPLPRIDATLESLAGSTLFTTLDLASGYWQVEIEEDNKEKTAFSTEKGHFEFKVMPFGLTNAPATFQRLMECILAGLTGEQCLIYIDDIIVFSASFPEHLERLTNVFLKLQDAGLKLKTEKCKFVQKAVKYLGHVVSAEGICPDPVPCKKLSILFAQKFKQGSCNLRIVLHKSSVIIAEAHKLFYFLCTCWDWIADDYLSFGWVWTDTFSRHYMSQVLDSLLNKFALLSFQLQPSILQLEENISQPF